MLRSSSRIMGEKLDTSLMVCQDTVEKRVQNMYYNSKTSGNLDILYMDQRKSFMSSGGL